MRDVQGVKRGRETGDDAMDVDGGDTMRRAAKRRKQREEDEPHTVKVSARALRSVVGRLSQTAAMGGTVSLGTKALADRLQ